MPFEHDYTFLHMYQNDKIQPGSLHKQRTLLYNQFMAGEISGNKVTPEKVVQIMHQGKNADGSKSFDPSEYLTVQQVTAAFSRMSSQYRKNELKKPVPPQRTKTTRPADEGSDAGSNNEGEIEDETRN